MDEVTEEDLRQHFASLDNGNKGYLDEADLANLVPPGDSQQDAVMRLMEQLDADKDGRVNIIINSAAANKNSGSLSMHGISYVFDYRSRLLTFAWGMVQA